MIACMCLLQNCFLLSDFFFFFFFKSAKPGVCPDDKDMIGVCVEDCFGDSECPDDEKCCSNGCGHQCTPPYDVFLMKFDYFGI
uniref:WAP domain-containing protein n=1 Tax=Cyprinus carpio TaxID=7962 RepID=A0A8C1S3G2_CYPCA